MVRLFVLVGFLVSWPLGAQPVLGPEVDSGPLPIGRYASSPVALAHDDRGTIVAWIAGDDAKVGRVWVARLDQTNHFVGAIREMPLVGIERGGEAASVSIAVVGNDVIVAWLERAVWSTAGLAVLDPDLNQRSAYMLSPTVSAPSVIARNGGDRAWIVAGDQIWQLPAKGTPTAGAGFGRSADDMTVMDGNAQIVAHRVGTQQLVSCACGGSRWICYCPIYQTPVFLYMLLLYGFVDEQQWPMAENAPPAIRANGSNEVLLVWFTNDVKADVMAMQVPSHLLMQSRFPKSIVGTALVPSRADIASDGFPYVIVWDSIGPTGDHDVLGALIDSTGKITQFTVANTTADERSPSVIKTDIGTFLIAYRKDQGIAGRSLTMPKRRRTVE